MRAIIRQFLGQRHSWAIFGWGMATALKSLGHQVDLFPTDGIQNLPTSLKENVIGYTELGQNKIYGKTPNNDYDLSISYTAFLNYKNYLSHSKQNRFGIWATEWKGHNILPTGFAKNYKYCDYICAPSNFAKQAFIDSGISENVIKVIPHGINIKEYQNTTTIELPTKKKFKILANIAQLHLRKNIPGLLEAYGKAFTNKDDVCLILKAKDKPIKFPFDVSLKDCLNIFYAKYPQHAELKVYSNFIEDMSALYRSIDAVYSMTHCEAFYFPGLESIAAGRLSIAPNYGGQLDFLNNDNALLIEGKETRANPKSMYWESKNNAIWFQPSIDDAVEKLRYAYHNYEKLNASLDKQKDNVYAMYDWNNIASQFLALCE